MKLSENDKDRLKDVTIALIVGIFVFLTVCAIAASHVVEAARSQPCQPTTVPMWLGQ